MRVLSVGNMYPPHHLGGYELMWRAATRRLRSAGHEVRILTTDHRVPEVDSGEQEPDVHRELRWYWRDHRFPRLPLRERLGLERGNQEVLRRHLDSFSPAVVTWWAMGGMSMSLIEQVRRVGLPAVGFVHDEWMSYGPRVDGWSLVFRRAPFMARAVERATGIPTRLNLAEAGRWMFVSETVRQSARDAGWDLPDTGIAHSGVDRDLFRPGPPRRWHGHLLYVGRIDERKGIDTAISALAELPGATLRVIGAGDPEHLRELRSLAARLGADERVSFGALPREELPDAYRDADAVLFPVRWREPWGLVPLEAMAVGRPVVATGTGGSGEYLRHGENCLIYGPPRDHGALAAAVERLAADQELRERLREHGFATAAHVDQASFERAALEAVEQAAGR